MTRMLVMRAASVENRKSAPTVPSWIRATWGSPSTYTRRTPGGPRFLTVGLKGQEFKLVLWPGTPGRCRKDFDALKARGVRFETEVLEFPWGYVGVFVDPDGNRLQLRQGR